MSVDQFLLSGSDTDLNYPNIRPTLDLNFARTKTLDPRITFTRASGGSYVGADGLIKYAGVNEPRFDHDPVTGESLGLLVEEQRSNLITYSEDLTQWTVQPNATVTSNNAISPSGNLDADLINSSLAESAVYTSATGLENQTYTYSVFLKAGTVTQIRLRDLDGGFNPGHNVSFNLSTLSFFDVAGNTLNYGYIEYPNNWYRVWFSFTIGSYTNLSFNIRPTGDQTGSFYAWGSQVEVGSFPTSYIPTQGSTRTRSVDGASITGKNFSDFYNPNEGTLMFSALKNFFIEDSNAFSLALVKSTENYIGLDYTRSNANAGTIYWRNPNVEVLSFSESFLNYDSRLKYAITFDSNYLAATYNNYQTEFITPVGDIPTPTSLQIGRQTSATFRKSKIHFKRIIYYPKRIPNEQLQALTR